MFNPLEMFQAQGEAGLQAMGQPFGLTTEQTARAFEALMPALTLGLQRSVGLDPAGFARMFGLEAAKPAPAQGFEALGQMFGSAQLMQAVLRQASATSGVGAQVLRHQPCRADHAGEKRQAIVGPFDARRGLARVREHERSVLEMRVSQHAVARNGECERGVQAHGSDR